MTTYPSPRSRVPAVALVLLALFMSLLTLVSSGTAQAQSVTSCKGEIVDGICVIDDGPICPDDFVADEVFDSVVLCRWEADPVITIQCPDGSRGTVGDCYVLVPKGPRPAAYCEVGIMVGELCVEFGPAPIPTRAGLVCFVGYGLVDNQCIRYSNPVTPAPECPVGSVEDANGDCRQSVSAVKSLSCQEPAGANFVSDLIGDRCVFTMPADCGAGVFDGVDRCVIELPGKWCDGLPVTIDMELGASGIGTPGDDVIWGTDGPETILAGGGDDVVCARGGDDIILGGPGTNRLFGQGGDDGIRGGVHSDYIEGGLGDDWLQGNFGDDYLVAGEGVNKVDGTGGFDQCEADPTRDKVWDCDVIIS